MIDMILYPLLLSFPLALLAGPVGSILVWRRSSFLSDVVSHMGILSLAISEATQFPILMVSIFVSVVVSLMLEWAPSFIPKDAWLSGISAFGISSGLILSGLMGPGQRFEAVFWGDIFTLTSSDVIVVAIAAGFLGMHLIVFWKSLMLIIFHEQLAALDGIPVRLIKHITNITAGIAVALCLKVMGVLLTGALFVLPSISLRFLRLTPEKHIIGTIILIMSSFCLGLWVSIGLDVTMPPLVIIVLIIITLSVIFLKKGIDSKGEK